MHTGSTVEGTCGVGSKEGRLVVSGWLALSYHLPRYVILWSSGRKIESSRPLKICGCGCRQELGGACKQVRKTCRVVDVKMFLQLHDSHGHRRLKVVFLTLVALCVLSHKPWHMSRLPICSSARFRCMPVSELECRRVLFRWLTQRPHLSRFWSPE